MTFHSNESHECISYIFCLAGGVGGADDPGEAAEDREIEVFGSALEGESSTSVNI